MTQPESRTTYTAMHWGRYRVRSVDGRVVAIDPVDNDPLPSGIGPGMVRSQYASNRITEPMARRRWLTHGPGNGRGERGRDDFVKLGWDEAFDLAAAELDRVRTEHGNEAIYGGSYGWASAGRFHHAQSQIHRFLRTIGGYTDSRNSYSMAGMEVITPHVIGGHPYSLMDRGPTWAEIAAHGELVVSFGGMPVRNSAILSGGVGRHEQLASQRDARSKGVEFVSISPWRNDLDTSLDAQWIGIRPGTDVAFMLAMAYVMCDEELHDRAFLTDCCVGFERFESYLVGGTDGVAKTPEWASRITGAPAGTIRDLARRVASSRTTMNVTWAVQRQQFGEQPEWLVIVLSAMSGSMGRAGGGPISGLGIGHLGVRRNRWRVAGLPQGANPISAFIPVARISDMLLHPGEAYTYDGQDLTYPHVRLVYWAGGNPFHHHQDLHRLRRAWQQPETVISHDSWWNPLTRHSDLVFPVATMLEREDFAIGQHDLTLSYIEAAVSPPGQVRSDHAVFCGIAERLGELEQFSEGRTEREWVRHLYDETVDLLQQQGVEVCGFEELRERGFIELPDRDDVPTDSFEAYRAEPIGNPMSTPSGKVEIFSETLASFGYRDTPGHPVWQEPEEWLGSPLATRYPLHLISPQPSTRLHSQQDGGAFSLASKIRGREPMRMNPVDMMPRKIHDGDVVEVYNDRGRTLVGVVADPALLPRVVALSTGAWFDPDDDGRDGVERHGNPNVLTSDRPTSMLGQGPASGTTLVEVRRFDSPLPEVKAFDPPVILARDSVVRSEALGHRHQFRADGETPTAIAQTES